MVAWNPNIFLLAHTGYLVICQYLLYETYPLQLSSNKEARIENSMQIIAKAYRPVGHEMTSNSAEGWAQDSDVTGAVEVKEEEEKL